jgi:hypothetical protein
MNKIGGDLGIDVAIDPEDGSVYLNDFLPSDNRPPEDQITGTINPMGRLDGMRNPRENLLVYFYLCVMAMENRAKYDKMREEEDAKKARRDNDNKVDGSGRGRGEDLDDAKRPLPDSQPST